MEQEAEFFKALSDATRLRLAILLANSGDTCVCQLAEALNEPNYKVSRHLGILRSAGLVESRREGPWMHYRLTEGANDMERCLYECFRVCMREHMTIREDLARLKSASCGTSPKTAKKHAARRS